jgi:hypothetical protein
MLLEEGLGFRRRIMWRIDAILRRTVEAYIPAIGRHEIEGIHWIEKYPRPEGLFYGLGSYRPNPTSKFLVLHDYLQVAKYLLPSDISVLSSLMWHSDLPSDNVFVNPERPTDSRHYQLVICSP